MACGVAVACTPSESGVAGRGAQPPPALALVPAGTDTLPETEQEFVGRVQSATVTSSGETFVVDQFSRRVFVFGPAREQRSVFGKSGQGPGEFDGPYQAIRLVGDTIAVSDVANQSVSVFARNGERFVRKFQIRGPAFSIANGPARIYASLYALSTSTAAATLTWADDSAHRWMALPASVTRHKVGMRMYPISMLSAHADSVAIGYLPSTEIAIAVNGGQAADSFTLPAVRRRAIPEDLDAAVTPLIQSPGRMTLIPSLDGLYWRPDGLLLAWHKDWIPPENGKMDFQRVVTQATLRGFVSVIDRKKRAACVDIPVPTDWAENPAITANADTLYVVGHETGAAAKPPLVVKKYRIDLSKCDWQPLGMP